MTQSRSTRSEDVAANPRPDDLEAAAAKLVAHHPHAFVGAIEGLATATPVLVPIPPDLFIAQGQPLDGNTWPDEVLPQDRVVLAKVWGQAHARGAAAGAVRLRGDPDRPGQFYLFDLRERRGFMLVVFVEGQMEPDPGLDLVVRPPQAPRISHSSKDERALIQSVDGAFEKMLGWTAEEAVGRRAVEFVHPEDRELGIASWMEMLESPGVSARVRLRHQHKDGSWRWLEVVNHNRLADQEHRDVWSEMVDISAEMEAHEALRAREQLLAQVTEAVPIGLFHADREGTMRFSNRRLRDLTGASEATTLSEHLRSVVPEDRPALERAVAAASLGSEVDVELAFETGVGTLRHLRLRMRPLAGGSGHVDGLTGSLEDVTDMVRSRRELEERATSDALTGCLNREATLAALEEMLDSSMRLAKGTPRGTAVIFADLDGFKPVNDELGHAAGDELLATIAGRLRSSIRRGDVVGRFGGDEFVVVCRGVRGPEEALQLARSLARRGFRPIRLDGAGSVHVKASMGVAWTDGNEVGATRLIQLADEAMYASKRDPRHRPVLASLPDLSEAAVSG